MKKLIIFFSVLLVFGFSADTDPAMNYDYYPVLMDIDDLRKSVSFEEPRSMKNIAKIYIKGDYLFVTEKYEGIHVINNSNPLNPQKEGFIRIPGCIDLAVKNNILYADNAIDLVAIDIGNRNAPELVKRLENVLPEPAPPTGYTPYEFRKSNRPENTVIVAWKKNE